MLSKHLSLCQVGFANLLASPHCCMANYTLPNHDLYMTSATTSQNSTLSVLTASPQCCITYSMLPNHQLNTAISWTLSTSSVLDCQLDFILQTAWRVFKLPKIKKFTGCSMLKISLLTCSNFLPQKTKPPIFRLLYDGLKHGELWKSHKI
jgi:hypothetical protein